MELDVFLEKLDKLPDALMITQEHVALLTMISIPTLERDRYAGKGMPFFKHGKLVRYKLGDVRKYISERTFNNTTQAAQFKLDKIKAKKFISQYIAELDVQNIVSLSSEVEPYVIIDGKPVSFFSTLENNVELEPFTRWLWLSEVQVENYREMKNKL